MILLKESIDTKISQIMLLNESNYTPKGAKINSMNQMTCLVGSFDQFNRFKRGAAQTIDNNCVTWLNHLGILQPCFCVINLIY